MSWFGHKSQDSHQCLIGITDKSVRGLIMGGRGVSVAKPLPPLTNWPVYSLKVGLASSMALVATSLLGVNDPISATFVAVVCTSPTVVTGLKRSVQQVSGSLAGGLVATGLLLLGVRGPLALGSAVGLSVWLSAILKLREAHMVSAFTALYVVILGSGAAPERFETRVLAVLLGAAATLPVNYLLSALLYRSLFQRRIRVARQWAEAAFAGGIGFDQALGTVNALASDLRDASRETPVRSRDLACVLATHLQEVELLQRLLHFGKDLAIRDPDHADPALKAAAKTLADPATMVRDDSPLATALERWADHAGARSTY